MPGSVENIEKQLSGIYSEQQNNEVIRSEQKGKLIRKEYGIIHNLSSNETLAVMNTVFNKNGKIKLKGSGLNLTIPFFQQAYPISTGKHNERLVNKQSPDGNYKLNIGIGEDADLTVKIVYEIVRNKDAVGELIKQQDTYEAAISTFSEKILNLKIAQLMASGKTIVSPDDTLKPEELAEYLKNLISIDIKSIMRKSLSYPLNEYETKIKEEALKLKKEYGVRLSEVIVSDVNFSTKMREIKEKEIISAKERKIQEAQAETDARVAGFKAQANLADMKERIKMLKEQGLSNNEIKEYIKKEYTLETIKNLPESTVAILNPNTENDRVTDIITAESAIKRRK